MKVKVFTQYHLSSIDPYALFVNEKVELRRFSCLIPSLLFEQRESNALYLEPCAFPLGRNKAGSSMTEFFTLV